MRQIIGRAVVYLIWLVATFGLIYVTLKGELGLRGKISDGVSYIEGAPEAVEFPININTATLRELKALNGIGTAKAEAIISYREEEGSFKSVDELINVSGIGETTLNSIREYITI